MYVPTNETFRNSALYLRVTKHEPGRVLRAADEAGKEELM
jgi:hypothetical protein